MVDGENDKAGGKKAVFASTITTNPAPFTPVRLTVIFDIVQTIHWFTMTKNETQLPYAPPLQPELTSPSRPFRFGPALLVTAAFIGPGTVLTASKAGAQYGYTLLWAIVFAVFTTIVFQEMAARLGIVSKGGLANAIRTTFRNPSTKWAAISLVLGAILFGNCAYQTGNIMGAATGLEILTPLPSTVWAIAIAVVALTVIMIGRLAVLQWFLASLVAIMGLVFTISAILCGPEIVSLIGGLKPTIPDGSEWAIVGLIGTTVVPYNLFLHASAAANKYSADGSVPTGDEQHNDNVLAGHVRHSLLDTILSITVGGIITASLMVTAAVTFRDAEIGQVGDIAAQLRPSLGTWAESIFAIGLFAAGLTSSITAPIAAAYAAAGCFGWDARLQDWKLRTVAGIVVVVGLAFAIAFGSSPAETIIVAQIANGLLLPIVAIFLLYVLNRKELLGRFTNGWLANGLGIIVVIMTFLIAARQFTSVIKKLSDGL